MLHPFIDQSSVATNIDKLVKDILSHRISFESIIISLNRFYWPFMFSINPSLLYAQSINAFIGSTQQVVGDQYPYDVIWDYENTMYFRQMLFSYKESVDIEKILRHNQEVRNRKSFIDYIRILSQEISKSLFVRVDLGYSIESRNLVCVEDFYDDIKELRQLISNKDSCFKSLHGNGWALEQGFKRGYHCHLLLVYNGSERQRDGYIGQTVGEKWKSITDNRGSYFNINNREYKKRFEDKGTLGVGMTARNNPKQLENVINTVSYLTDPNKHDQHLKVMTKGMVTFGRGQIKSPKR